ncbi:pyroglutamyl-peptidase I [Methyloligella halotolerans]|uniref:pyroglutamyl-peptidase I n=1 Tax=Methyloligella halotolerans TaxID=1177755 RepID=UPI001470B62B|nr:pyroglutamyl-peptidase I [Methyloligella halotolerans]
MLLTGFGPFPGVPKNPSMALVEDLADAFRDTLGITLHKRILSTEWNTVRYEAPALLDAIRPDIVIHFGLCRGANAIRIERSAYNQASRLEDAANILPPSPAILPGGTPRLDTPLSTAHLARGLRLAGIPALPSLSAGRYLCNYLYYLSLDWAAKQSPVRSHPPLVLFVHIPPARGDGGYLEPAEIARGAAAILSDILQAPRLAAHHAVPASHAA